MYTHEITALVNKLKELPPERVTEVEDFVDFSRERGRTGQALCAQTTDCHLGKGADRQETGAVVRPRQISIGSGHCILGDS